MFKTPHRLTASALVPVLALLVGCGGGGSGSSSADADSSSSTTSTPASQTATGPKVSAADFTATIPAGFRDRTSKAKPNPTTGKPPELQLVGPTTGGLKTVIRVAQLSANSTSALEAVAKGTAASETNDNGGQITEGPDASTVGDDDAFTLVSSITLKGKPAQREYVIIRHGKADYVVILLASSKGYVAGRPVLKAFLDSLKFG